MRYAAATRSASVPAAFSTRCANAFAWDTMKSLFSANNCCCGTVVTVRLSAVTFASGKSNSRSRPSSSCRLTFA